MLSLGMYFVVMPLSAWPACCRCRSGPLEFVLDSLYAHRAQRGGPAIARARLVVALAYRLITC